MNPATHPAIPLLTSSNLTRPCPAASLFHSPTFYALITPNHSHSTPPNSASSTNPDVTNAVVIPPATCSTATRVSPTPSQRAVVPGHTLTRSNSSHFAQVWRCNCLVSISSYLHASNTPGADHSLTRLVATLGSKSNLKKVSRKAILDVDVVKTCDTIIEPAAPMSLRLSSNLLCVAFASVASTLSWHAS